MKYAPAIITVMAMVVVGASMYEILTVSSTIQAKPEQSQNYSDKIVVIKANDGMQQTYIITQTEFTGITPNLIVSSQNTNSPANATLNSIANFLLANSGMPKHNFLD